MKKSLVYCVVGIVALMAGCGSDSGSVKILSTDTLATNVTPIVTEAPTPAPTATPTPKPESPAETLLKTMSLEEKVGQLFIYSFRENVDMEATIEKYKPGGIIYFSEDVVTKEQVKSDISALQQFSRIPLFICVDEEGGRVSRVGKLYDKKLPPAADTKTEAEALERGEYLGQILKELGFNINFAPSADVNTNAANKVIGDRAFSSVPETASKFVAATVRGMRNRDVFSVIKHFPGHGDTQEDSHYGIATAKATELSPFVAGIEAGAAGVMVGHISVPDITGNDEPATFSKYFVTDVLRDELNFNGVVVTDAMDMGAITEYYPPGEAAVKALEAGIDIVLMPKETEAAYSAVFEACRSGQISEERLNQSVLRILTLKVNPDGLHVTK